MITYPLLSLLILVPLLGAAVLALLPGNRGARFTGLLTSAIGFAVVALAMLQANDGLLSGKLQLVERHAWIPALHIEYFLGADGLSLLLLLLTAILTPFAILALDPKAGNQKLTVGLILLLQSTLFGTFTALNFIHWFLFYELSLIPVFLLIRLSGTWRATAAAFQFFVYTLFGGLGMLLGFLAIHQATGSFDLIHLAELGRNGELSTALAQSFAWIGWQPSSITLLVFCGIFLGLAVKVPVVPFHTWLPEAYAEAPTPVSMLMTGVLSKMGVYGFLRLLFPLFPKELQVLQTPLLALAVLTILFSALTALTQTDLKKIVAYSSINHLGYCLLGIFAAALTGAVNERAAALNGVMLQIFNHGITAAALFCFVGLIERRTGGLRGVADFGGIRTVAPVLCGLMGISIFSSLGLPGLNGFVGEFLIFKGAFALAPWAASAAAIGLFVTALFLLNMIQRVFTGPVNPRWVALPDLTTGERCMVAPIVGLMLVLGIYPQLLLSLVNRTVLTLLP